MLRLASGIILIIAGLIWILQGFDVAFAPKSIITGIGWGVLWGGGAVVAGAGMIWWQSRSG
ncbi:MAG: hypothetical protein ACC658_00940 [Acidimicrobiia bacterium]